MDITLCSNIYLCRRWDKKRGYMLSNNSIGTSNKCIIKCWNVEILDIGIEYYIIAFIVV